MVRAKTIWSGQASSCIHTARAGESSWPQKHHCDGRGVCCWFLSVSQTVNWVNCFCGEHCRIATQSITSTTGSREIIFWDFLLDVPEHLEQTTNWIFLHVLHQIAYWCRETLHKNTALAIWISEYVMILLCIHIIGYASGPQKLSTNMQWHGHWIFCSLHQTPQFQRNFAQTRSDLDTNQYSVGSTKPCTGRETSQEFCLCHTGIWIFSTLRQISCGSRETWHKQWPGHPWIFCWLHQSIQVQRNCSLILA